jgi:decaprenyl-phosphate phosphoribosyltransferase
MSSPATYLRLIRPEQFLKNGFIWLPIFFGYQITHLPAVIHTAYAFLAFCCLAGGVYVINDLRDVESDRRHPVKRTRPLAAGLIRPGKAVGVAAGLILAAFAVALVALPLIFAGILATYLVLNLLYSFGLKHMAIVDIVCIAVGFVLRVFAGGVAARVDISPWIVIMTFLLALFIALAKRRDDLRLNDQGHDVRKAIDGYNDDFISLAMGVMASVIIVAYILYTVSPEVVAKHGTHRLYITGVWVLLGLLRYLQITFVEEKSGSPTQVLLKDYVLQAVIAIWLVNIFILLYVVKG